MRLKKWKFFPTNVSFLHSRADFVCWLSEEVESLICKYERKELTKMEVVTAKGGKMRKKTNMK